MDSGKDSSSAVGYTTRKLTAQNLDGIVEAAFERVLRKRGKQTARTGDPEEDHISWAGASVLGGLLVVVAVTLLRRRTGDA